MIGTFLFGIFFSVIRYRLANDTQEKYKFKLFTAVIAVTGIFFISYMINIDPSSGLSVYVGFEIGRYLIHKIFKKNEWLWIKIKILLKCKEGFFLSKRNTVSYILMD